jgi:cyclophilin family peptidyl-prolyl cis-trans isomerase
MSKKKTRERQLARYQAKREAERRHKRRQRITAGIVAMVLAAGALIFLGVLLTGDDEPDPAATPTNETPTPTVSATGSETPTETPSVEAPPVACGGTEPAAAQDEKPTFKKMPALDISLEQKYIATIVTSCGTIEVELFADQAPYTVNSFIHLSNEKFYDGQVFHRIANSIDVIQAGNALCTTLPCKAPTEESDGGPGYTIPDENFNGLKYDEGVIAMANTGQPNTGGSQWFIVTGPLGGEGLNNAALWTVFGTIVEGLDVAQKIQEVPVELNPQTGEEDQPAERVYIESITIRTEPAS